MGQGTITEQSNGTNLETEAKTNAELTAELATLRVQLGELRNRLWGDEELHAKWKRNKEMYVTPNIAEPPKGHLVLIEQLAGMISDKQHELATMFSSKWSKIEKHLEFVDRVSAWIGPVMDDPAFAPPLNGAQVASKRYVDDAVARIAGALREEASETKWFVQSVYQSFKGMLEVAAVTWNMQPVDKARHRLAVIAEIAEQLAAMVRYVREKRDEDREPGPLGRLKIAAKYFVSGRPQKEAR